MSKNPIRKDKTCLNCHYVVENRFCPNCGQENIDTRKTFHHLFIHFFEDLTHYENAFWKTIKNLIFKPGSLTREYLSGKRMSYLAPVRLYIFISFVTFFVMAMLPNDDFFKETETVGKDGKTNFNTTFQSKMFRDSIKNAIRRDSIEIAKTGKKIDIGQGNDVNLGNNFGFGSSRSLDSIQRYGKPDEKLEPWEYWIAKKAIHVSENNTGEEIREKFLESFAHNFPKVLFIYMPFFAFVLWLFHNKRRWYYFDHGIFTLHYFSFLLVGQLLGSLFSALMLLFGDAMLPAILSAIFNFAIVIYMLYYFFPAHHRFYGGKRRITVLKGIAMFIINSILAGIIMLCFIVYTFINIH